MAYGTVNADVIGTSVAGSNLGAGNASIMKNRIINGAMVIDQRNAGASIGTASLSSSPVYSVDRFTFAGSQNSKFTIQQNAGSVTTPVGFTNYLGVTSSSAYTLGASDNFYMFQRIEGYNMADLGWGSANAKTVTISFWAYSSLTGTFGGSLMNGSQNYSYPFSYSIPVANTWTQISITIPGPTSGTWVGAVNTTGIQVSFSLGTGTTYSGTAGSWQGSLYVSATGATSVVGTSGATFYITGVQLEVGSIATGYEYRQYGQELTLCQRYLYTSGGSFNGNQNFQQYSSSGYATSSTNAYFVIPLPVTMRASPSYSYTGISNFAVQYSGGTVSTPSATSLDIGSPTSAGVQFTVSGMSAGQLARLYQNGTNATYLQFSAEL